MRDSKEKKNLPGNQESMNVFPSIVRRGNHFVRLPGDYWNGKPVGWILIDGPWFDYLTKLGNGYHTVMLPKVRDWAECAICTDSLPVMLPREEIEWEQIRWHPGTSIHPDALNDRWLAWRWREVLAKRKRWGWRLSPDGQLPAYLNHVQFVDDPWQSEQMYQAGY